MDKKDIYEHLAKIYLDASSKKKKSGKPYSKLFRNLFLVSIAFIATLSSALLISVNKKEGAFDAETALVLLPDSAKINFHFDPARRELYTMDLNRLNISGYKALAFSVKKSHYKDNIYLRVEFVNAYKEKSEVYFKELSNRWQDFKVDLSRFKGISDWAEMKNLSFIVEEWNVREKRGVVYLDNVRLLK